MKQKRIFLWHGDNDYAMRKELNLWLDTFTKKYTNLNAQIVEQNTDTPVTAQIMRIRQLLMTDSLFGSTKLLIFKNFLTEPKKSLEIISEVIDPLLQNLPIGVFLLFYQNETIKNKGLYKALQSLQHKGKAAMREFILPRTNELAQWIKKYCQNKGVTVKTDAIKTLIEKTHPASGSFKKSESVDLWLLANELDKAIAQIYPAKEITIKHVENLLVEKHDFAIWQVINCIVKNESSKASILLEKHLVKIGKAGTGEELRYLLNLLARQIKKLLIVKLTGIKDASKLARTLGWPTNQAWAVAKQAEYLHTEDLKNWQKKNSRALQS